MVKIDNNSKMDFAPVSLSDKERYEALMRSDCGRGCEFSFANLYLWGRQSIAFIHGQALLFSQFNRRSVYPYPVGAGDKRAALDAIIADSRERGIPCRITGLSECARELIEKEYPEKFRFHSDEDSFDYVYDINDLAELRGRAYQSKRNHINRFKEARPSYKVEPISEENVDSVRKMLAEWYAERLAEDPDADYKMEEIALEKALRDYGKLGLEGLLISDGERVLAFTIASRMCEDTFDVHFEKAVSDVQGAYTVINRELALYIREKYPEVKFLDREEDMGLEGLRRAKQSYHPHHLVKKYWACLLEEGYEY